jgi:hypothetical protein
MKSLPFASVGLCTSDLPRLPSREARIQPLKGGRDGVRVFGGAIVQHRNGSSLTLRIERERERENKEMIELFSPSDNGLTLLGSPAHWVYLGS